MTVSSMSLTIPYRTSGPITCTGAVARVAVARS